MRSCCLWVWLITVFTRATDFLISLILASLEGAPPVTCWTRREASSVLSSSSCLTSSFFFLVLSSWALTFGMMSRDGEKERSLRGAAGRGRKPMQREEERRKKNSHPRYYPPMHFRRHPRNARILGMFRAQNAFLNLIE